MRPFISESKSMLRKLSSYSGALLLFDFDGTISPIAKTPDDAILPDKWKKLLNDTISADNIIGGIVTGRGHDDVKKKIAIENFLIASNHGYEIWRRGKCLFAKGDDLKPLLNDAYKIVKDALSDVDGIVMEFKGTSLAVHYRLASLDIQKNIVAVFKKSVGYLCDSGKFEFLEGKKVIEVKPSGWNKGKAILWIWKHLASSFLPFYFGDDITDEDAFRALDGKGISVVVGKRKGSFAKYFVDTMDDAIPTIEQIIAAAERPTSSK